MVDKYKIILWDFDGVLINSMPVRDKGFERVLHNYPKQQVDLLMEFHRVNGGLSRYVKFKYFFEEIRKEQINEKQINEWAQKFSEIMRKELTDSSLLIEDSLQFVRNKYGSVPMHIVSASDEEELKFLTRTLGIFDFFKSVHGSPTPKKELIKKIIKENSYTNTNVVLIGDSINDFEAANSNDISFLGYNNINLKIVGEGYINSFLEYVE